MVTLTGMRALISGVKNHNRPLDQLPGNTGQEDISAVGGQSHLSIQVQSSIKKHVLGQCFSRELFQIPYKSNLWPWINHSFHLCAEQEKTSQQLMHAKALGGDGWRHYGAFCQWHAIRENHLIEIKLRKQTNYATHLELPLVRLVFLLQEWSCMGLSIITQTPFPGVAVCACLELKPRWLLPQNDVLI